MSVRLLVRQRSEAGGDQPTEVILDEPVINLGRDKGCQIVLAQQAVSRNHARISRDGSLFFLEDLGSAFGTQINGQALPKGEKRLLRNGDTIAIAQFDVTFDRLSERRPESHDKTSLVARQLVKDVMRGLGGEGPFFRVMNGPREGEKIEISDAHELLIGREGNVDIRLEDDLVSRRHAKVRRDWSGTHVEDLDSRNGIRVNKKRVNRKTLKDRDELEVGAIRLLYLDPSEVREAPVVLSGKRGGDEEGEQTFSGIEAKPDPAPPEEPAPAPEPAAEPSLGTAGEASVSAPVPDAPSGISELEAQDSSGDEEPFDEASVLSEVSSLSSAEEPVPASGLAALLAPGARGKLAFVAVMSVIGLLVLVLVAVVFLTV